MATWTRRETVTRTVEYVVPCGPYGAPWAEVQKALTAALADFERQHSLPDHTVPADNEIRFHPGDDEILIRFEVPEVRHANRG